MRKITRTQRRAVWNSYPRRQKLLFFVQLVWKCWKLSRLIINDRPAATPRVQWQPRAGSVQLFDLAARYRKPMLSPESKGSLHTIDYRLYSHLHFEVNQLFGLEGIDHHDLYV